MFLSYDLVSSSLVNGVCSTLESPPQTLSPPFSVTGSQLGYYEASSVIQYVQLTECGFSGIQATTSPSVNVLRFTSSSPPTSGSVLLSGGGASSSSALGQATSDFKTSPTFSPTSLLSGSASSSSATRQATPSTARQQTLSQGTIAGVAVGAAVFILCILASAILCWQRQRRSLRKAAIGLPGHRTDAEIKPDPYSTIWVPELGQEGGVPELGQEGGIPELGQEGAVHRPHELPGTPTPVNETARVDESGPAGGKSSRDGRVEVMAL